jgi:DNA adenine methylase
MQYLGGKTRIAKQLAAVIDRTRKPGQWVWDAFCGGLSMSVALSKNGPVWSTDVNAALINLYLAVQQGWVPPSEVSRETYAAAKSLPDTDPMKAFCGFGCSFGGKWFGGYAGGFNGPLTYPELAGRNVRRSLEKVHSLVQLDFLAREPCPTSALLYLDPPYANTTGYSGAGLFDSKAFIVRAAHWALFTDVFVSEYAFPIGECVWSRESGTTLGAANGTSPRATERLYHLPKGSVWNV